jgi:integrase
MSVYFVKGKDKGWRYDFTLEGIRHTEAWFKTKTKAKQAESKRREELKNPKIPTPEEQIQIDMGFLELVNRRLDHVKAYNSERHYTDHIYMARRWIKEWEGLTCSEITTAMIQDYLLKRLKETSPFTANKDLRYLRSLFNHGLHPVRNWITHNPTRGVEFFPVDKQIKYVPPNEDVLRVILAADPDTQDYLWTIALTMGRMSEINRLTWQDVNFEERYVVLYTRKKKGGHRTPRKIPMTDRLFEVLSRRYAHRDKRIPWVFWHRYWSRKMNGWTVGPFKERKKIMRTLCKRAGVKYFRYHALRHFGASLLEQANVPIGSIQRLLGHENRATTELYLHSIGESERQAMDALNECFESFSHTESHTKKKDSQAAPCKPLK